MKARLITAEMELQHDATTWRQWLAQHALTGWAPAIAAIKTALAEPQPVSLARAREIWDAHGALVFRDGSKRYAIRCDGCEEYGDVRVAVGEEAEYESSTATLCAACLREALALVEV